MPEAYKIVTEQSTAETEEKKSRFLTAVLPISSEEEALSFIEASKKKYWDASHNCSAYTLGGKHELTRCSDDGEPSQTAGRPMLDVLLSENIHDVCVIVTRYFGGTLLGTGGLVRAYQAAVKAGLSVAKIALKQYGIPVHVDTDYKDSGKIEFLAESLSLPILSKEYTDSVSFFFLPEAFALPAFEKKLMETTCGRAVLRKENPVWFCREGKGIRFLNRPLFYG